MTETLKTAMLHFSSPPVIGGVEEVLRAHVDTFLHGGHSVKLITGIGDADALADGCEFVRIDLLDTRNREIQAVGEELERGEVTELFTDLKNKIKQELRRALADCDRVIIHNVLTVHVNLPFTAAFCELLREGFVKHCIAWSHDFVWAMKDYVHLLHDGYPWDLLRSRQPHTGYVCVSRERRDELAQLFECPPRDIHVVYNGVDTRTLLGLSEKGFALAEKLGILDRELVILTPVRVVKSKNLEFVLEVIRSLKGDGLDPIGVVTGPPDPHDRSSLDYFRTLLERREKLGLNDNMKFVYECGPEPDQPLTIPPPVVGELFRLCDMVLIASFTEGFGMPVLEAGLAGKPVACSSRVPAAHEIAADHIKMFAIDRDPHELAQWIADWRSNSPVQRLQRMVRRRYTWRQILKQDIEPLLGADS